MSGPSSKGRTCCFSIVILTDCWWQVDTECKLRADSTAWIKQMLMYQLHCDLILSLSKWDIQERGMLRQLSKRSDASINWDTSKWGCWERLEHLVQDNGVSQGKREKGRNKVKHFPRICILLGDQFVYLVFLETHQCRVTWKEHIQNVIFLNFISALCEL